MSSLNQPAIYVEGLCKNYLNPPKMALDKLDLTIPTGKIFALLGPNGAGKSTLINILAGLVAPSSGHASINGYDVVKNRYITRRLIGVVPQELNLDPFFSPRELLELQAGLYGIAPKARKTDELLEAVGLLDKADSYARSLSGGMRRRLMVAKAMVHSPALLVLDEPTAGVDVGLRQSLWGYVRSLNKLGTTILLTTHYLEEAEELADHIAIINQGKLVVDMGKDTLLQQYGQKKLVLEMVDSSNITLLPEALQSFSPVWQHNQLIFADRNKENQPDFIALISVVMQNIGTLPIKDIRLERRSLEEIFLQLTE
ncbi:MAG: ABC transporter ATP-binding protein [Alphaproteobacteria bacterium]